jgi:hypothetical protein
MRCSVLVLALIAASISDARREFKNYESTTATYHSSKSEVQSAFSKRAVPAKDALSAAREHVNHIAPESQFRVTDQYTDKDTGATHVYFVQTYNDLDIENARANVNVSKDFPSQSSI